MDRKTLANGQDLILLPLATHKPESGLRRTMLIAAICDEIPGEKEGDEPIPVAVVLSRDASPAWFLSRNLDAVTADIRRGKIVEGCWDVIHVGEDGDIALPAEVVAELAEQIGERGWEISTQAEVARHQRRRRLRDAAAASLDEMRGSRSTVTLPEPVAPAAPDAASVMALVAAGIIGKAEARVMLGLKPDVADTAALDAADAADTDEEAGSDE